MHSTLHPLYAIGLRSDTSMNGVEVALIQTDGIDIFERKYALSRPYTDELRKGIQSILGNKGQQNPERLKMVEHQITLHHIDAVRALLEQADKNPRNIDVIAFPGHTILNRPHEKLSIQIGDVQLFLDTFQRPVVNRFYQSDLASGGQGFPIFPVFFDAITRDMPKPLAVISISGLTSVSYVGIDGQLYGFESGPGNMLIDQWMQEKMGTEMDFDGLWAAKGHADERLLKKFLSHPYFLKKPPKSADRSDFQYLMDNLRGLTIADGSATLTELTVRSIAQSMAFLPKPPIRSILIGGGAFNPSLVKGLRQNLTNEILTAQETQWDASKIEAQGFAFLAVRSLFGLPFSFPKTTGVPAPMSGGMIHRP